MDDIQGLLLSWAAGATKDERHQLTRRYLDILPYDELQQVSNNASKAKKRRKRQGSAVPKRAKPEEEPKSSVPTPEPAQGSSVPKSVSGAAKPIPESSASRTSVSVPESSVSAPVVPSGPEKKVHRWFQRFEKSQIVGLDVEKVEVPAPPGDKRKFIQEAAKVSVVDYKGRELFKAKIKHPIGSFRVTYHSRKVNGILEGDLVNGRDIEEVKADLHNILADKLVIVLNGELDFLSLDLPMGDYETFDCRHFWYQGHISPRGKYYREDLGLRSLCHYYFNVDMQKEGEEHDPYIDAKYTLKLFLEVYLTHPMNETKINPNPSNEIPHYKP